jgi:hypothetical protein
MKRQTSSLQWLWLGLAIPPIVMGSKQMMRGSAFSPLSRLCLSMVQDSLMSAFAARALTDSTDFGAAMAWLINEDGKPLPSAMGMKAIMKVSENPDKWPKALVTFVAKKGKGTELVKQLKDIWAGVVKVEADQNGDKSAEKLNKLATISAGEGDEAIFQIDFPQGKDEKQEDADLKAALRNYKPQFSAEVNFGRTLKEMYDNMKSSIVVLPHGISAQVDAAFASAAFDIGKDAMPDGATRMGMKAMMGIAKMSTNMTILYKSVADLGDAFDAFPSFEHEVAALARQVSQGPKAVIGPLQGLPDVADGVKSVVVECSPLGWEIVATFNNFHPSPLIASMIKGE